MSEVATRMPMPPTRVQLIEAGRVETGVSNPFQRSGTPEHVSAGTVQIEQDRAVAEAQGKLVIAKKFPRSETLAWERVMEACKRPSLAEVAFYKYNRGGQNVTGPSIRLAEELARCWGNFEYGLRELSRRHGESEMQAFAWDFETNTITAHNFTVQHTRDTRQGRKSLEDERDIYETLANMGARRMRARILALLPAWYVDDAVERCVATNETGGSLPLSDRVRKMVRAFTDIGVPAEALVQWLNHPIDLTTPDELTDLRGVLTSLKEGASKIDDWFGNNALRDRREAHGHQIIKEMEAEEAAKPSGQPEKAEIPVQRTVAPLEVSIGKADVEREDERPADPAPDDDGGCGYYLLDEYGEPVGDPHRTPLSFAKALVELHFKSPNKGGLLEQNADEIESAALADKDAQELLAPLGVEEKPELDWVVAVPQGRNGGDPVKYIEAIKASLAKQDAGSIDAWQLANAPTYGDLPKNLEKYRLMALQAIVERRKQLGLETPGQAAPQEPKADPGEAIADGLVTDIDAQVDKAALETFLALDTTGRRLAKLNVEQRKRVDIATQAALHGFGGAA